MECLDDELFSLKRKTFQLKKQFQKHSFFTVYADLEKCNVLDSIKKASKITRINPFVNFF